MAPQAIGTGQGPRVTAHGNRAAIAWETDDGFAVWGHDGADWGEEIALGGREAALHFASDGTLHAATTRGLWRLDHGAFEQVRDAAYTQPALAIDGEGDPHVAWVSDGQVLMEGEAIAGADPDAVAGRQRH